MVELGNILGYRGQVRAEAETLRRGLALIDGALVTLRASEGERHATVAHALNRKAALLIALLALAPAAEPPDPVVLALADSVSRAALELHREIFDEPNNDFWESLTNRATVLLHMKQYDEAEMVARESLTAGEAIAGRAGTAWISGASLLADIDIARGDYDRAAGTLKEIRDAWARDHGDDYLLTLASDLSLGDALMRAGQFEAAEACLLNAWQKLNTQRGSADRFTRSAVAHLVTLYEQWNRPEQAARFREMRDTQAANTR
jgi:tetratricopeptide (TPR) repeat protein